MSVAMKVLYVSKGEWKARPSPDEVNEGVVPIRGCGWSTCPLHIHAG